MSGGGGRGGGRRGIGMEDKIGGPGAQCTKRLLVTG